MDVKDEGVVKSVKVEAPARVGLLGNPSDIFYKLGVDSKVIALAVDNFKAVVSVGASDSLVIESLDSMNHDLIRASLNRFFKEFSVEDQNLKVSYTSNIPREVGLGGSTSIIVATLQALGEFYGNCLDEYGLAEMALRVETEELGITAGPQDRYAIAFGGVGFMDFSKSVYEGNEGRHGEFVRLDVEPPVFVAYPKIREERFSGDIHKEGIRKFRESVGMRKVMQEIADLAFRGKEALCSRDWESFGRLMNDNFEKRIEAYEDLVSLTDRKVVKAVLDCGALGATLTGSGGCVVFLDPERKVCSRLGEDFYTIRPKIFLR